MTPRERQALAVLLGVGGVAGVALILDAVHPSSMATLAITVILLCEFGLAIVAGWLLWRNRSSGYSLGLCALLLQVPHLEVPGLSYWGYTSGRATAYLTSTGNLGLSLDWGSAASLRLFADADVTIVGMNLFAALAGYRLYRAAKAVPSERGARPDELTPENAA